MATTKKYTTDGKCEVFAGKKVIARSYLGSNGYEVRVLQGVPREEVIKRIVNECPDFAKANGITENYYPRLFAK